jgi:hypothetical protein
MENNVYLRHFEQPQKLASAPREHGVYASLTAYLADIFDRIHDHKINRLDELLPWNWKPMEAVNGSQAA